LFLSLLALLLLWRRRGETESSTGALSVRLFAVWMLSLWGLIACINYAPSRYYVLFYPAMAGLAAFSLATMQETVRQRNRILGVMAKVLPTAVLALWGAINLGWMGDWLLHLTYRQRDADRWLAENLPPDSVLIGAVTPGLCMNNRFKVVNVIEDLCNDDRPVEQFAPAPRYILILDDRWKERWWVKHYPELVAPERRIHAFPHLLRSFFTVGVYPVP